MKASRFDYFRPTRLEDAIALLAEHGREAKAIAGGQSLVPMMAFRLAAPRFLVDIGRIPGLNRIAADHDAVRIGALVRWRDIERSPELQVAHPLLVEAVRHIAHYQIRNRGTVGGSLAHADPAAEMPGIAITCEARIVVAGPRGQRAIPATGLFVGAIGVGDTPLRLSAGEAAIEGKVVTETIIRDAGAAASESVHPADDIH